MRIAFSFFGGNIYRKCVSNKMRKFDKNFAKLQYCYKIVHDIERNEKKNMILLYKIKAEPQGAARLICGGI